MSSIVADKSQALPLAERVSFAPAATQAIAPPWWKQRHSWVFALVVAVNVAMAAAFVRGMLRTEAWMSPPLGVLLEMALAGLFLGQAYLAAIWLALGGLSTLLRSALVMFTTVLSAALATFNVPFGKEPGAFAYALLIVVSVALLVVLFSQFVLAPVRWLTGWRIDFDAAYHARETGKRMQLRLWHYLSLMFVVALPLAIYRLLEMVEPDAAQIVVMAALLAAITSLVAAPLTWLVLARQLQRRAFAAFLVGLGLSVSLGVGSVVTVDVGPMRIWAALGLGAALPLGVTVLVTLNLLVLRRWGLKVICVKAA